MARLSRLYAPNTPQLMQVRFHRPLAMEHEVTPSETLNLLTDWLHNAVLEEKVPVHGWALLNDRLALLATPPGKEGIGRLIQALARRFSGRIHKGRVFAERYRSALLQPEAWVLPGLIWLDTLPVRQGYVDNAVNWPWSSAAHHTGATAAATRWTTEHPDYWRLGNTPFERQARYRQLLEQGLGQSQAQRLEKAVFGQWALGDDNFLAHISHTSTRRISPAKRGRPPQQSVSTTKTRNNLQ